MDDKVQEYLDMEARYRKQAEIEPMKRDRHMENAEAWRMLAVVRSFFITKQIEMRDSLALFDRPKKAGKSIDS